MTVPVPEAVLDVPPPLYQRAHLLEYAGSILGMKMIGPRFRIGRHLLWRIAHDRVQVLADEGAGEITGGFGGVDDRRTADEQILQALPRVVELGFDRLPLVFERFKLSDFSAEAKQFVQKLFLGLLVVLARGRQRRAGPALCSRFRYPAGPAFSFVHYRASFRGSTQREKLFTVANSFPVTVAVHLLL